MGIQATLYKEFQSRNPEKFNEELIFMRREEAKDMHSYFQDVFASLKFPGVEFLSSETISDESKFQDYLPGYSRPIEESRLDLISAKFCLTHGEEHKDVSLNLFFPKLIDDFFFQLNGNRYTAVYQLTDSNFYPSPPSKHGIYLKTLIMPLGILGRKRTLHTAMGNTIKTYEYVLEFFKKKNTDVNSLRNMFYFFILRCGSPEKALDFLFQRDKLEEPIAFFSQDEESIDTDVYDYITLRAGSSPLHLVFRNDVEGRVAQENFYPLIATVEAALTGVRKPHNQPEADYWKRKILNSAVAKLEKADRTILSLERVYDPRTRRNLRELDEESRSDVYHVLRWMAYNHTQVQDIDSVCVYNRRIRLYEYMLYPLLINFANATYRILNSRNVDMNRLETVFNSISPMFIIRHLLTNTLFRYSNNTSTLDLFTSALRWSARGPQALGSSGDGVALMFRNIHPSYLGILSLNSASASDPGMSGTFVPMAKDIDNMFFKSKDFTPMDAYHQDAWSAFFSDKVRNT